jgi:hypothetical protein
VYADKPSWTINFEKSRLFKYLPVNIRFHRISSVIDWKDRLSARIPKPLITNGFFCFPVQPSPPMLCMSFAEYSRHRQRFWVQRPGYAIRERTQTS